MASFVRFDPLVAADPPSTSKDQHQIITMHDLVVEGRTERLAHLLRAQSADASSVGGGVVGQSPGELLAEGIADADDVTLLELADHLDDADGEQALGSRFQRLSCTVVNDIIAARPCGQADPSLPRAVGRPVREEQGPGRFSGEDPRQGLGLGPGRDEQRTTGLLLPTVAV